MSTAVADAPITEDTSGLTPAPDASVEAPKTKKKAQAEKVEAKQVEYTICIEAINHENVPTTSTDEPTWIELGAVSAATRPEAWELAKAQWPQLVPDMPDTPEAAQTQEPVRAKCVPSRNFVTIESRVEYVAPRQVATGI